MKKTELVNCPQWLLDADTKNEDVDFDSCGILIWRGGNFIGGNFMGGDFRGGYFMGGDFMGGDFMGGDFMGGDFIGGNFMGGYFIGGNFIGGDFRGGYFMGGDFRGGYFMGGDFIGGNFMGGDFIGERITRSPISIYGLKWHVIITPKKMKIGCQDHTHKTWKEFTEFQISTMAAGASEFLRINKDFVLSICDRESKL
jgi:hypothetical protein